MNNNLFSGGLRRLQVKMKSLICFFFLAVYVNVSSARYFDDIPRAMRMYDYRSYQDDSPVFKSYGDDSPVPRDGYFRSHRVHPQVKDKGNSNDGRECKTMCRRGRKGYDECWVKDPIKYMVTAPCTKPNPAARKVTTKVNESECYTRCRRGPNGDECWLRNPFKRVACIKSGW